MDNLENFIKSLLCRFCTRPFNCTYSLAKTQNKLWLILNIRYQVIRAYKYVYVVHVDLCYLTQFQFR